MATKLEEFQTKHAELEYYLKALQILLTIKKEFALTQRIEEKIIGMIKEISPEPVPTLVPETK